VVLKHKQKETGFRRSEPPAWEGGAGIENTKNEEKTKEKQDQHFRKRKEPCGLTKRKNGRKGRKRGGEEADLNRENRATSSKTEGAIFPLCEEMLSTMAKRKRRGGGQNGAISARGTLFNSRKEMKGKKNDTCWGVHKNHAFPRDD